MGGRKKKKKRYVVFCYYCDRHFDNEKVLIEHQRGKHFKCPICHRRLSSARGMMIHVFQVHKESIDAVPHSKKGRDSFELEIFGMVGVPQELVQERLTKIYGEPAAKKQKISHVTQPGPPVIIPGMPPRGGMFAPPPQQNQQPPMMGRGMPPPQFGMPPPQGFMPNQPGMPPPHMMHPFGGPPRPGMMRPGGPPMGPPQHMRPPQHHPGHPPQMMPPPQQQHRPYPGMMHQQPGMMPPQIQQQPISNDAKVGVVDRADHLIQQSTMVKKTTKKKINRIYDRPGVSMEEMRASHPKYAPQIQM